MKLPSRLVKSRHGVYYYRLQYVLNDERKEMRVSLRTKDVLTAKNKSFQISAIIIENRNRKIGMAKNFDPNDISTWPSISVNNHDLKKLDIVHPSGLEFKNINTDNDLQLFFKAVEGMQLELPENTLVLDAEPSTASLTGSGKSVREVMAFYATAKFEKLGSKTQYEYGNYQSKFADWIGSYKNNVNFPMRLISMEDVAYYINELRSLFCSDTTSKQMVRAITDRTIQHKYLASLGSLFEYAQTLSEYPKGDIPTRGHKVFTKKDLKRVTHKVKYMPFDQNELTQIFNPDCYLNQKKPADFWLPLLAIFSGGRISELCQLAITDIFRDGEIWAISINDEDYKKIKTEASRRIIPIHPVLIELGLLEYIGDARRFGGLLFPYLTPNKFGNYSETPSERFGKYLDSLSIKDPKKVFHSFRSTANIRLKEQGVDEVTRCQLIGHEYESTNDTNYSEPHNLQYIYEILVKKLNFNFIDFDKLKYQKGSFSSNLEHLCKLKIKGEKHRSAKTSK